MRYFWMTGASVALLGLAILSMVSPSRVVAQEQSGDRGAASPPVGELVEIGLVQEARFTVPQPKGGAPGTVQSFAGKLIRFDDHWVGVEIPGAGQRMWVARENVAFVVTRGHGAQTQPATGITPTP